MQQLNYLWFDMQPMLGLSEDMVQQRADPRLGGKYPPKAAARVKLYSLSASHFWRIVWVSLHILQCRFFFMSHKRYMHNFCVPLKILRDYLFSLNLRWNILAKVSWDFFYKDSSDLNSSFFFITFQKKHMVAFFEHKIGYVSLWDKTILNFICETYFRIISPLPV